MKTLKLFEDFEFSNENDNDINLALELENKFRTINSDSEFTIDDFFDEFNIEYKYRNDFALAAILNKAKEYENMTDKEFFKIYNEYKQNI